MVFKSFCSFMRIQFHGWMTGSFLGDYRFVMLGEEFALRYTFGVDRCRFDTRPREPARHILRFYSDVKKQLPKAEIQRCFKLNSGIKGGGRINYPPRSARLLRGEELD